MNQILDTGEEKFKNSSSTYGNYNKKQKVYEAVFMDDIHGGWYLDANWL